MPANWNWRAWLTLVSPVGVFGFFELLKLTEFGQTIANSGADVMTFSHAAAWAGVWLLAPWIRREGRIPTLIGGLIVIGLFGLTAFLGWGGSAMNAEDVPTLYWIALAAAPLIGASMAGFCCRRRFQPPLFFLWTALFTPMAIEAGLLVVLAGVAVASGEPTVFIIFGILSLFMTLFSSVAVLTINMPTIVLACSTDFHRERCEMLFHRPAPELEYVQATAIPNHARPLGSPFDEPGDNPFDS